MSGAGSPEQLLEESWYLRRGAKEWISRYPSIRKMALSIVGRRRRGSPATVNGYIGGIKKFIKFLGDENPETVLTRIKAGEVDPIETVNAEGSGFIDVMLRKYANKTVHTYVYGVKKWLEVNGVEADWKLVDMPTTAVTSEKDRAPTVDEIIKLLNHSTQLKDRVVILILASSGLRIGTLLSLKWGDVDFDYPDVARITVRRAAGRKFSNRGARGGESQLFVTWITPESKEVLLEYKRYREARGEIITSGSPLIESDLNRGEHMTVSGYHHRWYRILRRAGLDQKSHKFHVLHIQTLRKFFRSRCVGVDSSFREQWMGHRGGYLDESYFRAEEPRHLMEYRKAVPYLSVYATEAEEEERRKRALLDFARFQGWNDMRIGQFQEILQRARTVDEAAEEFRILREEIIKTKEVKVVHDEDIMVSYIQQGWELMRELEGNRYLIRKP